MGHVLQACLGGSLCPKGTQLPCVFGSHPPQPRVWCPGRGQQETAAARGLGTEWGVCLPARSACLGAGVVGIGLGRVGPTAAP